MAEGQRLQRLTRRSIDPIKLQRAATTTREHICRIARCQPADLVLPFTVWAVTKLAQYLTTQGVVERISKETLRQILKHHGLTWRATKTWKVSNDPDFRHKMDAILVLYDQPPPVYRQALCRL